MKTKIELKIMICAVVSFFMLSPSFAGGSGDSSDIDEMNKASSLPIKIESSVDFQSYGFDGYGTVDEPWIIENYDINGTEFGYCIYIANTTDYFIISDCVLYGNGSNNGIYLYRVENGLIFNNNIFNCEKGIFIEVCSYNNVISSNLIHDNQDGIYQIIESDSTVINNTIYNNSQYGIFSFFYSTFTVENNEISENGYGIALTNFCNCTRGENDESINYVITDSEILNNTLTDNEYGIYLYKYVANVHNNQIISNNHGLYIYHPHGGDKYIYHNNFIDNVIQATGDYWGVYWNLSYSEGGNYWSDYTGIDMFSGPNQDEPGSDGIGDSPYVFSVTQDNYPLMEPWNFPLNFTISLSSGWNLISIPLEQEDTTLITVLSSIAGQYDIVKYYDTTDLNDPWKTYRVGASTNDLIGIDHKMGFWVHMLNPANITVVGDEPVSTDITLYAGWNLVGYPSSFPENVANALWGTGADQVEVCDLAEPGLIKEVEPTYIMQPGEGYWIHVSVDSVWTVNW